MSFSRDSQDVRNQINEIGDTLDWFILTALKLAFFGGLLWGLFIIVCTLLTA